MTPVEPIEPEGPEQDEKGQGAQSERSRINQPRRQRGSVREARDSDDGRGCNAHDIQSAEIEDAPPGGGALARVQPEVRAEGAASRLAGRWERITRSRNGFADAPRLHVGAVRSGKEGVGGRHEANSVIPKQ
ncbi:hypothetical protein [Brevundimonas sp. M-11_2]|uniref:hypothetical protein n=1 Tax=Brevundimonas sp. M-11_2 TaxID=3233039 RepID=UPI003F93CAD1